MDIGEKFGIGFLVVVLVGLMCLASYNDGRLSGTKEGIDQGYTAAQVDYIVAYSEGYSRGYAVGRRSNKCWF